MRRAWLAAIAGVALLGSFVSSAATPPSVARTETDYLLGTIEASGCEFFRNGSRYDARQAAAHLRGKYESLAAAGRVVTAEDFIDKVASRSSLSGRDYGVRCGGGETVPTGPWLRAVLDQWRRSRAPPT